MFFSPLYTQEIEEIWAVGEYVVSLGYSQVHFQKLKTEPFAVKEAGLAIWPRKWVFLHLL